MWHNNFPSAYFRIQVLICDSNDCTKPKAVLASPLQHPVYAVLPLRLATVAWCSILCFDVSPLFSGGASPESQTLLPGPHTYYPGLGRCNVSSSLAMIALTILRTDFSVRRYPSYGHLGVYPNRTFTGEMMRAWLARLKGPQDHYRFTRRRIR